MTDFPTPPAEFLTPEESAEVDKALLSSRERFSARVAIYSLRSLKQISQENDLPIHALSKAQILEWVEQDDSAQADLETTQSFKQFFSQLVLSSLKPLGQIAQENETQIEQLTPAQVITWFEKTAKARIEQDENPTSHP